MCMCVGVSSADPWLRMDVMQGPARDDLLGVDCSMSMYDIRAAKKL